MTTYDGTKPLIIYSKRSIGEIRQCVLENYGKIRYELPFINALCVDVPTEKVEQIKNHRRVALVSADAEVSKLPWTQNEGRPATQEGVWAELPENGPFRSREFENFWGFRRAPLDLLTLSEASAGQGVTIAIIDTGLAPHYDVIKPYNRILAFQDFLHGRDVPYDDDGHGTHVAGIAAGNGFSSGSCCFSGDSLADCVSLGYSGVAYNSNIVALKALDENGNGVTSDILAAMQWVVENKDRYNIKVLNLSLGIDLNTALKKDGRNLGANRDPGGGDRSIPSPLDWLKDPLVLGANAVIASGITVVAAAGNSGPGPCSITSPGISPYVITVGSEGHGRVPDFSSRGPTPFGLHKPDLIAPGVDIISLDAKTGKTYIRQTGTSMSAPAVAGAAACLAAAYPNLTPRQIKKILMSRAVPLKKESRDAQGAGLLEL